MPNANSRIGYIGERLDRHLQECQIQSGMTIRLAQQIDDHLRDCTRRHMDNKEAIVGLKDAIRALNMIILSVGGTVIVGLVIVLYDLIMAKHLL